VHALVLVDDLMFASRIREAARSAGVEIRGAREPAAAVEAAVADRPALVILDLDRDRLRPFETIRALRSEPRLGGLPIVGFVSHVETDRVREAEQAGCSRVLARGAFVRALPELLARPGE